MDQDYNVEGSISIRDLLYVLKKNLILLFVIVIIVTAGGFVYANMQKPNYTAQELVFFKAQNISYNETTSNIKVMVAYVDTIKDFCNEGVVLDRADYYYDQFLQKNSKNDKYTVDAYISEIRKTDTYERKPNKIKYFDASAVSVQSSSSTSGNKPFSFRVGYTAGTRAEAEQMVKILVLALKNESVERTIPGDINSERKYFSGVNVDIIDEGLQGVSVDVNKTKTILLFIALGVALGVVVVFVKNFFDNTIKTKEELEYVTGFNVLAVISNQGGAK